MFPGGLMAIPGLLGSVMGQEQVAPQAPPAALGGPPAQVPNMGPPGPGQPGGPQGGFDLSPGFGGFFQNMDRTLQSPSKVIGLGLLNRLHPAAGIAGLLGSGFFNG